MSFWQSIDALAAIKIWTGLLTIVLAVITFGVDLRQQVLQKKEDARKESEKSDIRRRAEEARSKVFALEAKQEPRSLSPLQTSSLKAAMAAQFEQGVSVPIVIASKMLDPESENYAREILVALSSGEKEPSFTSMGIFPFQGVRIFSVGEQAQDTAIRIRNSFQAAKIQFSDEKFKPEASPIAPPVGVFVYVGYK